MRINLPTQLTLLRLGLVPFFLIFTVIDNFHTRIAALVIFIVASLTDLYDGRLARQRGEVTTLGVFLDPLADKFLISSAFIAFVQVREIYIPAWMVVLVIGREFLITGLRTLAASKGRILPAQPAGKFKTTSQIVAIIAILIILCVHSALQRFWQVSADQVTPESPFSWIIWLVRLVPWWLMLITTILTIVSGFIYLRDNMDLIFDVDRRPN